LVSNKKPGFPGFFYIKTRVFGVFENNNKTSAMLLPSPPSSSSSLLPPYYEPPLPQNKYGKQASEASATKCKTATTKEV